MTMKLSTRQVDGVTIVDCSGRITLGEGSVMMRDTVRDLLGKGNKKIILNLGDDENRFSRGWMTSVSDLLDEVDAAEGPRSLLTVATGKFWSNGLDLDWLTANVDQAGPYVDQVQGLFARYLELTVPTVAVLQGHTFAAGALLALANDLRVMRADRGFFCLPEVDI